ncbi:MAG: phage major capsid protein [Nitrospirales bacterium]
MDLLTRSRVDRINEILTAVKRDLMIRENRFEPGATAKLGLSDGDLSQYSIARAIRYRLGLIPKCLESECDEELHRRMELPLGSFAVPSDVLQQRVMSSKFSVGVSAPAGLSFVDMLRNKSICYRLGVQRLSDLKDDVAIPRQLTDATVAWMTPNGTVSATESTYGQISATPKTAVAITEITEQLLHQAGGDQIIMAGLAGVVSVGIDLAIINGTGGAQPLGILNTPGIGTASGTSLAYAGLVGPQKTVADASAIVNPETLGYATTPTVAELLKTRQRFTGTDSPLWRGALHEGEVEGIKALASKQLPTATMLYGDWSSVYVGEWGPLLLSADRGGTRFNTGIVGIRAMWMVDTIITSPSSFVKITSIT